MIGKKVGKITIQRQLGKGGMGDVYVGFDETLERGVAVKVISGDNRKDEEAKARFTREAKILSKLEHPNICRIYDYIQGEQEDFIIMELIQGRVLDESLTKEATFAAKIDLSCQVAGVLNAAHAKNIAHRDLKPDNVMIAEHGIVKVLDFGIGHFGGEQIDRQRAPMTRDQDLSGEDTLELAREKVLRDGYHTQNGQLLGTPMFMSPEQARGRSAGPASDLYSLGLLMQWLFTGQDPYPRPITAMGLVTRAMRGESLPVEGIDPDVTRLINELKSLSPNQRPNAATVVEKLQWIAEKPKRRLKKCVTFAFLVVLFLGACLSTIGFVKAKKSERRAKSAAQAAVAARDRAEGVVSFLEDMLASARPEEAGIDIKVVDVLERAAQEETEYPEDPLIKARIHYTLSNTFVGLGAYDKAEGQCRKALEIRTANLGLEHTDTLASMSNLSNILSLQGRYAEVAELLPEVLKLSKKVLGEEHAKTLSTMNNLGVFYMNRSDYENAVDIYEKLVAVKTRVLGEEHTSTLGSISNLAICLMQLGHLSEAERRFRAAISSAKTALGEDHPGTILLMSNLAWTLDSEEKYDEAEEIHRQVLEKRQKVLGPKHPYTLWTMNMLGSVLHKKGAFQEAEQLHRETVRLRREVLGDLHPETVASLTQLAMVLFDLKRQDDGLELVDQILALKQRAKINDETLEILIQLHDRLSEADETDRASAVRKWCEEFTP